MEVRYLETSEPGLRWFRAYYRQNPQLSRTKAIESLGRAEATLGEFPMSGTPFEDFETVRESKIQGTAFSLLYTIARDTVWVIDLRDQRGRRSAEVLQVHAQELSARYGIGESGS